MLKNGHSRVRINIDVKVRSDVRALLGEIRNFLRGKCGGVGIGVGPN